MNALKPVRWIGSSRKDVRSFPARVKFEIGQAICAAQNGETDPAAKPLKGFGIAGVLEIVTDHRGATWRSVYRALRGSHLRLARVPEEIKEGHRHPESGS